MDYTAYTGIHPRVQGYFHCMELELEGGSVEASGNIEVTLPNYMTMLPQEELDEARRAVQRDQMIVAAGRKPGTDEVVILTATSKLMVLKVAEHGVPEGRVIPIDWGHGLAVEREGYYEMAADWAIANAEPIDIALLA